MAVLLNCKLCGGIVASDADKCPHCGTPNYQLEKIDSSFAAEIHFEFNCWHTLKNTDILINNEVVKWDESIGLYICQQKNKAKGQRCCFTVNETSQILLLEESNYELHIQAFCCVTRERSFVTYQPTPSYGEREIEEVVLKSAPWIISVNTSVKYIRIKGDLEMARYVEKRERKNWHSSKYSIRKVPMYQFKITDIEFA